MKKLILIIATVALSHSIGFAQSCLPEGITFTTQEQIDNFQTNYPGCTEIEGDVTIQGSSIINLNGLNVLTSIGGGLYIGASNLTSLSGLENLTSIEGPLSITDCNALTSLSGIENLTSIGGGLLIGSNNVLNSLTGLDNLTYIGDELRIYSNSSLSTCDALWLCGYLTLPNGTVNIYNNATGCNSIIEVAYACGGLPCLPFGEYDFYSQDDIDNFEVAFPDCTIVEGSVSIHGNDITNLNGLSELTSIEGTLLIGWYSGSSNPLLTSLTGLENLVHLGGFHISGTGALIDITSLSNLSIIDGNLSIVSTGLSELTGLNNVSEINGSLGISWNPYLVSLSPLENLAAGSIIDLSISNNQVLSFCEVQSICDYLAAPGGTIVIEDNAPGCNSPEEVEEACDAAGLEEPLAGSACLIFPTPASDRITFDCSGTMEDIELIEIYNTFGVKVAAYRVNQKDAEMTLDVQALSPGLYFLRLQAGNEVRTGKVIKR